MSLQERTPLLLLTLSIAAVGIQALMLSPLLTDIAAGLGTQAKEIGFAASAYGVGVATAALLAAPQFGRWPKRGAIRIAFAVLAVSLFLCAFAWDWRVLAGAQLIAGLASGVIIPATYALTGDIAPPDRRSQDLGKVLFGWSIAMVAGVPLAAVLSAFVGWRGTFLIVGAVAAMMPFAGMLLPKVTSFGTVGERVRYMDVLRLPGAWVGYVSTFAYMIAFYQTYTFIGDHVRQTHGAGAWLGGTISLAYGIGFGLGVIFDKWIDAKGPTRVLPLGPRSRCSAQMRPVLGDFTSSRPPSDPFRWWWRGRATPARTASRSPCPQRLPASCSDGSSMLGSAPPASARATRCASRLACRCTVTSWGRGSRRSMPASAGLLVGTSLSSVVARLCWRSGPPDPRVA